MDFVELLPALAELNDAVRDGEPRSLEEVAALVERSPFLLQREFKAHTGESPKQYQLRLQCERAAVLLAGTDARILDVALAVGFSAHASFTRAFQKQLGLSPDAFRKSARVAHDPAPCLRLYRKALTNKRGKPRMAYDITEKQLDETPFLFQHKKVAHADIAAALAECLPGAFGLAASRGWQMGGPPAVRYMDRSPAFTTIEAGVPLALAPEDKGELGEFQLGVLMGGNAAHLVHKGPYEKLGDAYAALDTWLNDDGRAPRGAPWEVYLTDPGEVPNPEDWLTAIYWPC